MCGHKHTFSNSRLLREDPANTMKPIIYDSTYVPATESTPATYPTWYSALNAREQNLCQLSNDSNLNFVKYVMCQATGYKQTSNKELPAERIPWLANYFPSSVDVSGSRKPNAGQQYPFYIRWTISSDKIVGDVIKLDNIMTSGKFNINQQNEKPIAPLNGNGSSNSQIIINL